jgi:hypothetical protein
MQQMRMMCPKESYWKRDELNILAKKEFIIFANSSDIYAKILNLPTQRIPSFLMAMLQNGTRPPENYSQGLTFHGIFPIRNPRPARLTMLYCVALRHVFWSK